MIFKILLVLVVLTPLPFASVYSWSTSLLAVLVGGLLLAWQVEKTIRGHATTIGFKSMWGIIGLFLITVLWVFLQTSHYVPGFIKDPLWNTASRVIEIPLAGTVSINPEATRTAMMGLLTYAGIFWLSLQYCRESRNANLAIKSVIMAGFIYAIYGLLVEYSGSQSILWFDKFAYLTDLTSTFVNRNSYATYAGLGLVCTTGVFLKKLSEPLTKPFGRAERLRQLIDDVLERTWFYLVIWVVLMMALLLSHSRAGFISTVFALIALSIIQSVTKGMRLKYVAFVSGLSIAMISVVFYFGGGALDRRFGLLVSSGVLRPKVYQQTLDYISEHPLVGTGYGTFAEAFQSLQTPAIPVVFLKAHNTYLEVLFEMGVLAAVPLFTLMFGLTYILFKGIRIRRHGVMYPAIGMAATVLVFLHSFVDFSLQIPAVAATYCLILGVAVAQSTSLMSPKDKW